MQIMLIGVGVYGYSENPVSSNTVPLVAVIFSAFALVTSIFALTGSIYHKKSLVSASINIYFLILY